MRNLIRYLLSALLISSLFISCKKVTTTNLSGGSLTPPTANAGPSPTIQVPVSTVTVTGTGTTTNGYITGYLWSLISGPNLPDMLTPSAPTTTINNLVAGNYLFQFAVIDSAGLTGIDTLSVIVVPSSAVTLTLQPSGSSTELCMIYSTTEYSDPLSPELVVEAWTSGGFPFTGRGLLKFDLTSIPAGATILSAKLSLFSDPNPVNGNFQDANFGTANAMYLSRVTANWNSSTLFSNTPASDASSRILIPHTNNSFEDLVDIDVTSQVGQMATGNNYGFLMQLQNEVTYNCRLFGSSRHADASKHPKLVVIYQ